MAISLDEVLLAMKFLKKKGGGGSDGGISTQSLSVTANGIYRAPSGKAYTPVTVNVPQTEVESLTVNANGTYTPESGMAYGPVTVNVPQMEVESLSVNANGTYTPESGTAYGPVAVNVPQTEVEPLTVNANGTYTPESGTAYGPVTVNVQSGSGGGGSTDNDVIFYDYDGSVVASYTASEFATVNVLPANPSHEGLTAQGWNWTLEDAKTYVGKYGKLIVGQMYTTDDGKTRIYIHLEQGRLAPYLGIAIKGTATVEWGDGNTDTVTGTSTTTVVSTQHVYATAGDYVIKIAVDGAMCISGNDVICSQLLWKNTTVKLENAPYENAIKKVEIGRNVNLKNYSFAYCYGLETITIPNTVQEIGYNSFVYCCSLKFVTVPNSISEIGQFAFNSCVALKAISFSNSITGIDASAFGSCYELKTVSLPTGLTIIERQLFSGCRGLTSVIIPNGVTTISTDSFKTCSNLASITIPDSVINIYESAFVDCYNITSITIPSGITTLPKALFQYCYGLISITIPSSVTSIAQQAFGDCYGLGEIHFKPATPPTVANANAWTNLPTDCIIYVPAGSLAAYTSAANYPSSSTYQYVEE